MYCLCNFIAVIQCPELAGPSNGIVMVSNRTIGSVATYSCDNRYNLVGAVTTECLPSEIWSNEPPVCECT